MVILAIIDLKTPVKLFKDDQAGHGMRHRVFAEAKTQVRPACHFGGYAVAAADYYGELAASLFERGDQSLTYLLRSHFLAVEVDSPDLIAGLDLA